MHQSIHFTNLGARPDLELAWETLLSLARALYHVGLPAHVIETKIHAAAERLHVSVEALSVPTGILLTYCSPSGQPVTVLTREAPAVVNLELLDEVVQMADELGRGQQPLAEVKARLKSVLDRKPRWSEPVLLLSYVLSSSAFAVFFGGGLVELLVAVLGGLTVGTIAVSLRRVRTSTRLFELGAALGAALLIYSCESWIGDFEEWIPLAAALIVLLPGVSLVEGINELASGHLLAGGTRMAGVAVAFLALTFGTVVGVALANKMAGTYLSDSVHIELPPWAILVAIMFVGVGSMIRFRAPPASLFTIILSSAVALVASHVARDIFGNLPGAFIAALTLGLLGKVYSYFCDHAAELFTVPGLAVLVPGSVGVQSMRSLLSNETTLGIDEALQMMLIAMALVSGLLFANSIWKWKGKGA